MEVTWYNRLETVLSNVHWHQTVIDALSVLSISNDVLSVLSLANYLKLLTCMILLFSLIRRVMSRSDMAGVDGALETVLLFVKWVLSVTDVLSIFCSLIDFPVVIAIANCFKLIKCLILLFNLIKRVSSCFSREFPSDEEVAR